MCRQNTRPSFRNFMSDTLLKNLFHLEIGCEIATNVKKRKTFDCSKLLMKTKRLQENVCPWKQNLKE